MELYYDNEEDRLELEQVVEDSLSTGSVISEQLLHFSKPL